MFTLDFYIGGTEKHTIVAKRRSPETLEQITLSSHKYTFYFLHLQIQFDYFCLTVIKIQ